MQHNEVYELCHIQKNCKRQKMTKSEGLHHAKYLAKDNIKGPLKMYRN